MHFWITTVFWSVVVVSTADPVRCPLKWITVTSDAVLPSNSITTQKDAHYVISGTLETGLQEIGRLKKSETENDIAFGLVPTINDTKIVTSFSILTNSFGCRLTWVDVQDPRVAKNGVTIDGNTVGRVMSHGHLLPASVQQNQAVYIDQSEERQTTDDYFVLISYNDGLLLTLRDFQFGPVQSGSDELFGYDQLINHADVDVMYSVTHSKITTDTVTITESHSTTTTWSLSMQVNCKINFEFKFISGSVGGGIGLDFSVSSESGWGSSITHSQTRVLTVARSVFVPPRTSIMACSTASTMENVQVPYNCLAEYRSPGLNGTEILDSVKQHFPTAKVFGNAVIVEVEGTFGGSLSLSTTFTVKPYDAFIGCDSIAKSSE